MKGRRPHALLYEGADVGYGDSVVVRAAGFGVAPGEFVGLVGPNGAGKSTLLRAVTGDATVLGGRVRVLGEIVSELGSRERARRVGVVPQSPPALFAFTARAFVEMGRHPWLGRLELPGARDAAIVEDAMRRTDTERLAEMPVDTLSGGDLQRLTVAQALAQQPDLLLLDEPISHLDLNHRLQILDLVRDLAAEGMAVLGVFHDLDLAARYADKVAVVWNGAVTQPLPPAGALDAGVLDRVFGVKAVVRTDPVSGSVTVTPVVRGADLATPRRGRIGVVGGSGAAAALMRRLALAGFEIVAGALNDGDIDRAVAEALGATHVAIPAFGEVDEVAESAVRESFDSAEAVVVAPTPFGRANLGNLRAAVESGRPLLLMGGIGPERDYAHGEATALWRRALDAGAVSVDDEAEALDALGGSGKADAE